MIPKAICSMVQNLSEDRNVVTKFPTRGTKNQVYIKAFSSTEENGDEWVMTNSEHGSENPWT